MNSSISRRSALQALAVAPFLSGQVRAAEPMISLFDGRTLAGWSVREGPESAFYIEDGAIAGSPSAAYPAWLKSDVQFENFDFTGEFFLKGWCDGGFYFSAPEHGKRSTTGFKVSLFHQLDEKPRRNSAGSIYPSIAPAKVNVKNNGAWNQLRVRMDWPSLQVWMNGERIHNLDCENQPELKYRLRSGYFGLETLTYPLRFRNLNVQRLPSKQQWESLYESPADLSKWQITESNERSPARFLALGDVLRGDGLGNLTTREKYRDFELQLYVRGVEYHNGGILFRSQGGDKRYEIQLHDVAEAHYPTGSLYHYERAKYPDLQPEAWFFIQLLVKDQWCMVRINGENVMEYNGLEQLDPGFIELQAHQTGRWIEYKHVRVRKL